jgi:putative tryptophan/tyrosine transport system substrate-binding protein
MSRLRRLGLWLLALQMVSGLAFAAVDRIWIATSGEAPVYKEAAQALAGHFPGESIPIAPWRDTLSRSGSPPTVLVTLGLEALKQAVASAGERPGSAIVGLLVPRYGLESIPRTGAARLNGVYLDQPFHRQLQWLRLALPERRRLGVLLGPDSKRYAGEIRQAAEAAGLDLVLRIAERQVEVAPGLQAVLAESDLLLAVPDSVVFSGQMAQYVLLASYRHGLPLIGYSAPMVKAGAAAALVATPEQIGRQGAALIRKLLGGGRIQAIQAPDDFAIMVNPSVARALELAFDEVQLKAVERRMQGGR